MMVQVRIFGLLADHSGCGYYRVKLPLGELTRRGHDVMVDTKIWRSIADDTDIIVGQRVVLPQVSAIWQHLASEGRARLVYEIDDDLWSVPADNPASELFCGDTLERLTRNVQVAHAVTVTTPELAERVRPLNPNVHVLPNCVDSPVLDVEHTDPLTSDPVHIGWQGSPTHRRDFQQASSSIARLLRRSPRVQFWTLGGNYITSLEPSTRTLTNQIFTIPWIENDWPQYYRAVSDIHIGLAPLASSMFNNSKSHIKALEYAALGIPCIVSNEPPYRSFVQHGETGFIVKRDHEWIKYMSQLVNDDDMRREMSHNAREYATDFTMQHNVHRWEELFTSLVTA